MINLNAIINLSGQLKSVANRIQEDVSGYESIKDTSPEIADDYEHFVLDDVSHAQIIVLELTRLLTESGEENGDEAFGPGDLNESLGEKEEVEEEPSESESSEEQQEEEGK